MEQICTLRDDLLEDMGKAIKIPGNRQRPSRGVEKRYVEESKQGSALFLGGDSGASVQCNSYAFADRSF